MKNTRLAILALGCLMIFGLMSGIHGYVPGAYNQGPFKLIFKNETDTLFTIKYNYKDASEKWNSVELDKKGVKNEGPLTLWKNTFLDIKVKNDEKNIFSRVQISGEVHNKVYATRLNVEEKPYYYMIDLEVKNYYVDSESLSTKDTPIEFTIKNIKKVNL